MWVVTLMRVFVPTIRWFEWYIGMQESKGLHLDFFPLERQ